MINVASLIEYVESCAIPVGSEDASGTLVTKK